MIKTITNVLFKSAKTNLNFDIILDHIEVTETGFDAYIIKVFKNTDGTVSEEAPFKRDIVSIKVENELNLFNNIVGKVETKIVNKYTT